MEIGPGQFTGQTDRKLVSRISVECHKLWRANADHGDHLTKYYCNDELLV